MSFAHGTMNKTEPIIEKRIAVKQRTAIYEYMHHLDEYLEAFISFCSKLNANSADCVAKTALNCWSILVNYFHLR